MEFELWNNWVLMALLTPMLWAVCCVIDVCLVGEEVYKHPSDGAIISGLFCIIPILFIMATHQGRFK